MYKYRILEKFNNLLLNKTLGVVAALLIPFLALFGGYYFSNTLINLVPSIDLKAVSTKINSFFKNKPPEVKSAKTQIVSVFGPGLHPLYVKPKTLKSEKIDLNIDLQVVDVDSYGRLKTPTNWNEGGWFIDSAMPGESGNIIINAHYDDNHGRPAAFWQLKNLSVGDKVVLVDYLGRNHSYFVKETFLISINDPDRLKVFEAEADKQVLTLVTCGGVWIPGKSTYDKRLVVKADTHE